MRTYVQVSLGAIIENYRKIRDTANAQVMAVVKANAFGHGAVPVSQALEGAGLRRFAVASVAEGAELRDAGVSGEVVLLYGLLPGDEPEAAVLRLTPTIGDQRQLDAWAQAARAAGRRLSYHLELDTGMSRLGFAERDPVSLAHLVRSHPELELAGVCTHLASAEIAGDEDTAQAQQTCFGEVLAALRESGIDPPVTHVANTAAVAYRTRWCPPLVRTGLGLYGYVPASSGADGALAVRPALAWRARALTIRAVPVGERVGYGGTYTAARDMRVAVVAAGYADGLDRRLSNRGALWFAGQRCPIVGAINMDLTLADVTSLADPPSAGDELLLLGPAYDADAMARDAGTNAYEVLTGISGRVARRYLE